ncbi:MAG: hypothetical protein ABI865_05055, partial [Nitrosospira sp.]
SLDPHLYGEFTTGRITQFLGHRAALQLLGMGRPGASHEGSREAGIGQRRGCRDRASWRHILLRGRTFLRKALLRPARRTIPRRCALPCTPKTAHSAPSNCRM